MKNKLSIIVVAVFMIGFVACTKSSPSVTPVSNNNPSITLNGQTSYLSGTSRAYYTSPLNNDSVVIVNTSTNDTSFITNLLNLNSVSNSVNYVEFKIASNTTISQNATYTRGSGNTISLGAGFQVNSLAYSSKYPASCTVTVDTLNTTFISGSYTASAINTTNGLDGNTYVFSGRFRGYFK